MKHYVGLDVSMKETSVCVVDEKGKIKAEEIVATDPKAIATYLKYVKLKIESVGLESGSLSHWLTEELLKEDLPVKCIDARHCAAFLSMQINKTDRNDARGIAEVMRCNIFREVQLKSRSLRETSALLASRNQLVTQRTQILMSIRGLLKPFGVRLGAISKTRLGIMRLWTRIQELDLDSSVLQGIEPLVTVMLAIAEGIQRLDKQVKEAIKNEPAAQLLMTIPGVGPVTALKYLVEVGDPARFKKSRSVGAYIGLTPTQYASGETQRQGRISKRGSRTLRSLLVEAAIVLMTRTRSWSKLKAWGLRLMKKKGLKKAATAVARKLAVIMHQMLLTGETFRFGEMKAMDQVA
jgi:transposase